MNSPRTPATAPITGPGLLSAGGLNLRPRRLAVVAALALLAIAPGDLGELTRGLMTDAFVQVSVFVAATLLIFYGAERLFRFDMGAALKGARLWQVPIAAFLGATPGCGGAVVVVAAYASGNVRFGAVVAALTATMGDAAFLLIATRPEVAAALIPLQFGAGIITGYIVDRFMTTDYRPSSVTLADLIPKVQGPHLRHLAYLLAIAPGLVVGVAQIANVDLAPLFGPALPIVALGGVFIGLLIWAVSPVSAMTNPADPPVTRMAEETAFISVWVVIAYLAYDYAAAYAGLDLTAWFQTIAPVMPLIAAAIGLVPGCGPQVLVTTLYINGAIPFSALLANAISNDGDALFPAIALAPRAAIMATVVSMIPALILAYGFYIFAPGFMN